MRTGGKYGYIDSTGKVVIPLEIDWPAQPRKASSANPDWDFPNEPIEQLGFGDYQEQSGIATLGGNRIAVHVHLAKVSG